MPNNYFAGDHDGAESKTEMLSKKFSCSIWYSLMEKKEFKQDVMMNTIDVNLYKFIMFYFTPFAGYVHETTFFFKGMWMMLNRL